MVSDCPLYSHIKEILATSFKLDYIGRVLEAWDEAKDGKLLVLIEFVVVAFFVVEIRLFLIIVSIISIQGSHLNRVNSELALSLHDFRIRKKSAMLAVGVET